MQSKYINKAYISIIHICLYICIFKYFTHIRVSFVAELAQNSLKRLSAIFWIHLRNNAFSRMILKWPKARPFSASPHPPRKEEISNVVGLEIRMQF